jgi:hypothetical protein
MPVCPNCHAECQEGSSHCRSCGVELAASLTVQEPVESDTTEIELVELAGFPNASAAEMIQELLESNGISTVIRGYADPIGTTSGAEPATLLVDKNDLAQAREIYEAFFAGDERPAEFPPAES